MKKIASVFIVLCLLLSCAPPVCAAEPKGLITLVSETGHTAFRRGDEFAVTVELNRNPGLVVLRLHLEYDRELLELYAAEDLKLIPGALFSDSVAADDFVLYWANNTAPADFTVTGKLATLRFRVKNEAAFGETLIHLSYSERLYDILNVSFDVVNFDILPLRPEIFCHHPEPEETVLRAATLAEAGLKKMVCAVCGHEWEEEILPRLESENKRVSATVTPGDFADGAEELQRSEKEPPEVVLTPVLFGAEFDAVKAAVGDKAKSVFCVEFTRFGKKYIPEGEAEVSLATGLLKNEFLSLYRLTEEGLEKLDFTVDGENIVFSYSDSVFALAQEPQSSAAEQPAPETTAPLPSAETVPAAESEGVPWKILLIGGGGVLLFGTVALVLILTGRKNRL